MGNLSRHQQKPLFQFVLSLCVQKNAIKQKLPSLDSVKVSELQQILEQEQNAWTEHHQQISQIRLKAAEDKVKTIYQLAEQQIEQQEEDLIQDLDAELEALES